MSRKSQTDVTRAFVAANPDWAPANKQALIDKGLVTDTYLDAWKDGRPPANGDNLPVTSVSWYAAQAYCAWFTKQVQTVLPGYTAGLPSESEWEWAARGIARHALPVGRHAWRSGAFPQRHYRAITRGASEPNGYGLRDMLGNVWEWCRTLSR